MTNKTEKLGLPFIMAAQAQKHVTHNEALQVLDAVIQLTLQTLSLSAPPPNPLEGQVWFVAATATAIGPWENHEEDIAIWQDGAWMFTPLQIGWRAWIVDEAGLRIWDGQAWQEVSGQSVSFQNLPDLGVNASADATNRLSLRSPASLFSHEGADHRLNINKQATSDTGSIIFQTNFSARAELGLTGDDNFSLKVSEDGNLWHNPLRIDAGTGKVSFPTSANEQILDTFRLGFYPRTDNGNWYRLCEWESEGTLNTTAVIFDVSHRSLFTFQAVKIRFEKRTEGFELCRMKVTDDIFRNDEEYLLVATNANNKVALYHKRLSGHFAERYMSIRHMYKDNNLTRFEVNEVNVGTNEPEGDVVIRITAPE